MRVLQFAKRPVLTVALLSVVVHGAGIELFVRRLAPAPAKERPVEAVRPAAATTGPVPERITLEELRQLRSRGEPVILADVRTERSYREDNLQAQGALRLPPDEAVQRARELGLEHHATVALYCT